MTHLYQLADSYLIWFYRLTGIVGLDFVIGTLVLALFALLIGEVTVFLAFFVTRRRLEEKAAEAEKYKNLSMDALKTGDKEAFRTINKLANEAFGHSFFQQIALSAAFLWPVFLALAWMQERFLDLEFPIPGTSWSLGYIGVFIILYLIAYFLLKGMKRGLFFLRLHVLSSPETVQSPGGRALPSTGPVHSPD